jgi:hypothetical protein
MQQRAKAYQIIKNELLSEIQAGSCGGHIGARALAAKVLRQGFYWLVVIDDASKIVATCEACQKFSHRSNAPALPSQLIMPSWPLQTWGIDIVGPLPASQGNYKYALMAVEYFTKWIESKPITNITSATMKKFFWQNIICRFRVPRVIMVDNVKQFENDLFQEFCDQIVMKVAFTSVYHLQTN